MTTQHFVLSWGRKIFFGLGWPLLSLVALNYFTLQNLPRTWLGGLFFVFSYFGQLGAITCLLYFGLFLPLARPFPGYYFSRFWAIFLVLSAALFLLLDTFLFSRSQSHLNLEIAEHLFQGNFQQILGTSTPTYIVVSVLAFALLCFMWLRGEKIWRTMQKRFSNPVRNWYLALILLFLFAGEALNFYGETNQVQEVQRLSRIFPLQLPLVAKEKIHKSAVSLFKLKALVFQNARYEETYQKFGP